MRIALFTETFLPKIDGIVNTLCYLLDHLTKRGHTSLLFAPEEAPVRYNNTQVIGLPGIAFPLYPELKLVPPNVDAGKQLAAFQPDLVHVVNPFAMGLVGLNAAKNLNVPIVASYHTDIPGFAVRWGFGFMREPFWTYLRWLHNQADLNLCPSRVTQDEIKAQGFERTKIWSRGVDIERFHPRRRSAEWRSCLSKGNPDNPLLLYVGRLSAEKRVDWLRSVFDAIPQANIAIVGDGPAREELEACFAGTNTMFTGFLRGNDLACAYASADIFAFPSANETLGNVVLEAMASGLPVVAPRSGGVLDNVVDTQTGLLFESESQDDFITAINELILHEWYARRLAYAGRKYAEQKNWSIILDRLLDDYATVISRQVEYPALVPVRKVA